MSNPIQMTGCMGVIPGYSHSDGSNTIEHFLMIKSRQVGKIRGQWTHGVLYRNSSPSLNGYVKVLGIDRSRRSRQRQAWSAKRGRICLQDYAPNLLQIVTL